jgi:restriction system protein
MSVSSVPLPPDFFHPLLVVLSRHPTGLRRRDLHEPVADLMQLTPAQRAERLPSGAHLRYRHRMGWGLNMLKNAGYIEAPTPGTWRITERGRDLLAQYPNGFDDAINRRIVRQAQGGSDTTGGSGPGPGPGPIVDQTPEERIEAALAEVNATLVEELLQRIGQAPPVFFEDLVLELLHAMGYGSSEDDVQRVGRSGDGGIDGTISLDKLGLEKIYVQAKRWQGNVGRPEVQGFFGALGGRRAKKGVFITTSSFTREAREFGEQISDSVVLIDGPRLASLLIEHGVGVTHRVIRLPRIDGDYFAEA